MTTINVIFYKPQKGKWMDWVISTWTGIFPCNWGSKPYSHVEIHFPETAKCFSSSSRGVRGGVRILDQCKVIKHRERWDYIPCEITEERWLDAVAKALKLEDLPYDWWGIFGFAWPWNTQDKNKWYCSEICSWFLDECHVMERYKRISPTRLARKLSKAIGKKPVPLKYTDNR